MLAVYYGCGLRRNEGVNLDIHDILFDKNLVYVRKGKNYKERYVPMSAGVKEDLQNYIDFVRPVLIKTGAKALFLNQYGKRLGSNSMADRLQNLKEKAEINKEAGLHALRHSIATHLLQSGMELEKIKRFLGHASLESTQIYTHIAYET
jgi:site-specific recombinase XerD